jgi:phage tail-like protein
MPPLPPEPFEGSHFVVDLGSGAEQPFARVDLPVATLVEIVQRSGGDPANESRKQPGLASYGHLVLHRGLTTDLELWTWWKAARDGDPAVDRDVLVRLLDDQGHPRLAWRVSRAFPVVHRIAPLDAVVGGVLMETVELAFDTMEIEAG